MNVTTSGPVHSTTQFHITTTPLIWVGGATGMTECSGLDVVQYCGDACSQDVIIWLHYKASSDATSEYYFAVASLNESALCIIVR